jgi:pimeloyl-ACP methyl ester carboxylesterase
VEPAAQDSAAELGPLVQADEAPEVTLGAQTEPEGRDRHSVGLTSSGTRVHEMRPRHVVLLHGQPGAGSDWGAVVDRLPAHIRPLIIDRPGYRSSPHPAGDFYANARSVLAELDAAGIDDALWIGHSYGGGVALAAAELAPSRVSGLVLVASIGPKCLTGWDTLLAASFAGPVCAVTAWWLTPWFARARLARIVRLRDRPLDPDEYVNWEIWASARHQHGAMWRTFLVEQRALVRGLDELVAGISKVTAPTLLLADPGDTMVPIATAYALRDLIAGSRLQLVNDAGHHLPRRTPQAVAEAITEFLQFMDETVPASTNDALPDTQPTDPNEAGGCNGAEEPDRNSG